MKLILSHLTEKYYNKLDEELRKAGVEPSDYPLLTFIRRLAVWGMVFVEWVVIPALIIYVLGHLWR